MKTEASHRPQPSVDIHELRRDHAAKFDGWAESVKQAYEAEQAGVQPVAEAEQLTLIPEAPTDESQAADVVEPGEPALQPDNRVRVPQFQAVLDGLKGTDRQPRNVKPSQADWLEEPGSQNGASHDTPPASPGNGIAQWMDQAEELPPAEPQTLITPPVTPPAPEPENNSAEAPTRITIPGSFFDDDDPPTTITRPGTWFDDDEPPTRSDTDQTIQALERFADHPKVPKVAGKVALKLAGARRKSSDWSQDNIGNRSPLVRRLKARNARHEPAPATAEAVADEYEIDVATAEHTEYGHDRILRDDKHLAYAVIDGMGGFADADVAAEAVHDGLRAFWQEHSHETTPENAEQQMRSALQSAQEAIVDAARAGEGYPRMGAVATAMHLFKKPDGSYGAVIGHVGDAQALVRYGDPGTIFWLTQDEGDGQDVWNFFSPAKEHGPKLEQVIVLSEVPDGARFTLATDGITGDRKENNLTLDEYAQAFNKPSEQAAANEFIRLSKKVDDKSVIVIDVSRKL